MVPWAHPSLNPNGILIGSAVLAGLTSVTDRQTDRQTDRVTHTHRPTDATRSVTTDRIYVGYVVLRCGLIRPVSDCCLFSDIKISQGSVATMRCGRLFNDGFTTHYCWVCRWKTFKDRTILVKLQVRIWCFPFYEAQWRSTEVEWYYSLFWCRGKDGLVRECHRRIRKVMKFRLWKWN